MKHLLTPTHSDAVRTELERSGYVVVTGVIDPRTVEAAVGALAAASIGQGIRVRNGTTYAIRNLLEVAPDLRSTIVATVDRQLIRSLLGDEAFVNRAILFDKPAHANWRVGWHQDSTIAVREKLPAEGFGPWSTKLGVVHVRPPGCVLDGAVTARVALDDCDEDNGALRVIPGSHRDGILGADAIKELIHQRSPATVTCRAGNVLLMKPLLLHASHPASRPAHRRVIHLEFASLPLPPPLAWRRA